MTNYHQLSLTLSFFRIFSIIYSYKNNNDLKNDCDVITQYVTDLEDASTTNIVREKMMDSFISFLLFLQYDWRKKRNNDQFHNAMRNIILDMNREEKQIVNFLITQFASEIGLKLIIAPIDAETAILEIESPMSIKDFQDMLKEAIDPLKLSIDKLTVGVELYKKNYL